MKVNFNNLYSLYSELELSCESLYSYEGLFGVPVKDTGHKEKMAFIVHNPTLTL